MAGRILNPNIPSVWIQPFSGRRDVESVREQLPTYLSTAPMVNPGGRVVGRSLSEWTTRSTLRRTSRKQSLTEAPLCLQLCDREKRHVLGRVLRTRARTDYCLQLTADRPHSLVSLQSVLQLFGEQALLSNLEKQSSTGSSSNTRHRVRRC